MSSKFWPVASGSFVGTTLAGLFLFWFIEIYNSVSTDDLVYLLVPIPVVALLVWYLVYAVKHGGDRQR